MQVTPELVAETVFSLESLIASRYRRMLAAIGQRVGVDDLLQVVAEKAIRFMPKCTAESQEQLEHWILTIAENSAKSMIRDNCASLNRSTRRESIAIGVESRDCESGFQPADLQSDPSVSVELSEAVQSVLSVLDRIPKSQAIAVRLRYLEQKGNDEIAEAMGVTNDAVRCLISRGLSRARKLLSVTA